MNKVILWDFDGTLGYREGNWEEAIFELSSDKVIKNNSNSDLIGQMLQTGFPWHQPQIYFEAQTNGDDWWTYVMPRFIEIFKALGYAQSEAIEKANQIPQQYGKLEKWKIYNDTIACLMKLQNHNWKSVLVTNNIPEFPFILKHLNVENYFDAVFVSSLIGFNKPNPLILNRYLETLPRDIKIIVVGDREESDIEFAKAILADGILVRTKGTDQTPNFSNLVELTGYLLSLNFQ